MQLPFCPIYNLRAQDNEPARPAPPLRFVSLFAGIGGFDLGLERAGMQCVGQVEIDPYCQAVLAHHWPDVKRIGDIRDVKGDEFGTVELVCGGFPCQPFSNAGKRGRSKDNRFLWPEMLRTVSAFQANWFVGENVSALDDKVDMVLDRVCADLETIGYEVGPPLEIPACSVNAPHERKRLFILAYSKTAERRRLLDEKGNGRRNEEIGGSSFDVVYSEGSRGGRLVQREERIRMFDPDWASYEWLECEKGKVRRIPSAQSGICPVAYGVPGRMAKLRGYGNAVVPQIIEEIGRAIIKAEDSLRASCPPLEEGAQKDAMEQNVNSI